MSSTAKSPLAIVAVGYNRPACLRRLLSSLARANIPPEHDVPLVVSIDHSSNRGCAEIAEGFAWSHGPKTVIIHDENLGLRNHILACGDLSQRYGAVAVLEDDVVVSPFFYHFALQALDFYKYTDSVGGIALYSYDVTEHNRRRFIPLDDGYDCYFLQIAASWGQVWTAKQWTHFRDWYRHHASDGVRPSHGVPAKIAEWSEKSWKKYYIRYLIETDRFFAYPRTALSTNFGEAGTHTSALNHWDQTPLCLGERNYRFSLPTDALAVYDAHFELLPSRLKRLHPPLAPYDFTTDLMGTKDPAYTHTRYLLSSKQCDQPIVAFGFRALPDVANIVLGEPGDCFSLGTAASFTALSAEKDWMMYSLLHKLPESKFFRRYSALYRSARALIDRLPFKV